jgi:hypothetical protein
MSIGFDDKTIRHGNKNVITILIPFTVKITNNISENTNNPNFNK